MFSVTRGSVIWFMIPATLFAASVSGADGVWNTKSPARWTSEEAQQILSNSPWAKQIIAGISRRLTEEQLREGGQMGQPTGVGNEDIDPKGSGPKPSLNIFTGPGGDDRSPRSLPRSTPVRIVWESAAPVRLAELKSNVVPPPVLNADGYEIAIYGIPGHQFNEDPAKLGAPLRQTALLRREGKPDVKPSRVEVFDREDGLSAVYIFPLSAEITARDGFVLFSAQIGRVTVSHVFRLNEMEFLGHVAI